MIKKDLSIDFLGVHFENPFCLSSSPVGNCYEMCKNAYDAGWGGIVYKTLSPDHFVVDEVSPRFAQLTKEDTPFIAFKNMEQLAEHPLAQDLDAMRRLKKEYPNKVLIASIMGETPQDWTDLAKLVTAAGADMIELNFSCPQMTSHTMGSDVGTNPELCKSNCAAVKRGTDLPVLAKMTPNITTMIPVVRTEFPPLTPSSRSPTLTWTTRWPCQISTVSPPSLDCQGSRLSQLLSASCNRFGLLPGWNSCQFPGLGALKPGKMPLSLFSLVLPPSR